MMEVRSPSLQNVSRARHIEQAKHPSVDTELSLGLPASVNEAAILPQGTGLFPPMPVPLSSSAGGDRVTSLGREDSIETLATLPVGAVYGNETTCTSSPDNGPPPSIPTASYWTTPTMSQNSLFIPTLPNVGSAMDFDKAVARNAGSETVLTTHTAAPLDTEAMRVEGGDGQPDIAMQPPNLEESQSSLTVINNMYSDGKTQVVHDIQVVEADDRQPAMADVTQPVYCDKSFDNMEVLVTSAPPPADGGSSVLHEVSQGTDARPLQDFYDGPGSAHSKGIPSSSFTNVLKEERKTDATAERLNGRVLNTTFPTVNEGSEAPPAETAEELNLTEGKEERIILTSESQPSRLDECIEGKNEADGTKFPDGAAEIGVKDHVNENAKIMGDENIQAIKGKMVVKKFGRKNFKGEVVDYDAENQWFKVVYEDGDDEDLTLLEVEEILSNEDSLSNVSAGKRKRSQSEGAVTNQQARKQKATPKGKASAVKEKVQVVKSPPGSTMKGSKRKAKSEGSGGPVHSQSASGNKRKRSFGAKLEPEKVGEEENSKKNGKISGGASPKRKSSANQGTGKEKAKKALATKREKRHGSFSKPPVASTKVNPSMGTGEDDKAGKGKSKCRKIDPDNDQNALVGRAIMKDFSGTLYRGVVTKFDKKTEYFKVEYEDGDQEDLELEEVKAVLVH